MSYANEHCENCRFWKRDRSWSNTAVKTGKCHYMPAVVRKSAGDFCSCFLAAQPDEREREGVSHLLEG